MKDEDKTKEQLIDELNRIRERDRCYRIAAEQSNDGVAIVSKNRRLFFNRKYMNILGYDDAEEFAATPFLDCIHPDDRERVLGYDRRRLEGSEVPWRHEFKAVRKGGPVIHVDVSVAPITYMNERAFFIFVRDITERKQVEESLRESEERHRTILENVEEGYYEIDLTGNFIFFNNALLNLGGYTREELLGMNNRDYSSPETSRMMYGIYREVYETGRPAKISNFEVVGKNGGRKVVEVSASLMRDADGRKTGFRGIVRDVTARRQAENLYQTLAEKSFAGVYVVQDGKFRFINRMGASFAGYRPEEMIGRRSDFILHLEDIAEVKKNAREMISGARSSPYEFRIVTKQGRIAWIMETVTPIYYEGRPAVLGNSMEVSERKQYEEEMRALSITDQLTGLYNRRGFMTLAEQQLRVADRTKKGMLLLFVDLDDVKGINDTFGHRKGDEALIEAANVLREAFRESDIIARIGGDEFAVLALGASADYPNLMRNRLLKHIDLHNSRENREYAISMSLGIAFYHPDIPCSIDELMSRADALMYEDKKSKRVGKPS